MVVYVMEVKLMVLINWYIFELVECCILFDNVKGVYLVIEYLICYGYCKIVYIGFLYNIEDVIDCCVGYKIVLKDYVIELIVSYIELLDLNSEGGE